MSTERQAVRLRRQYTGEGHQAALAFYRRTSIEAKRLDSILRTVLYAGFSEALNGRGTIRAYKAEERFIRESEQKLDSENRVRLLSPPSDGVV